MKEGISKKEMQTLFTIL